MKNLLKNKWTWITVGAVCLSILLACLLIFGGFSADLPTKGDPVTTTSATTTGETTTVAMGTEGSTTADEDTAASSTDMTTGSVDGSTADSSTESSTESSSDSTTTSVVTTTTTTKRTTKAPKTTLTITSHNKTTVTTNEPFTVFAGTSDPKHPLLLDGVEVKRDKYGTFSVEKELTPGKNTFTFTHKDKKVTYTVTYNYVVMRSYSPDKSRRLESGASFSVVVNARVGSTVTATFRGKTITLTPKAVQNDGESVATDTFIDYVGSFTLPKDNAKDLDLGKVSFRAVHSGVVSTAASGTIVCKKAQMPVIGEIVTYSAETFDGDKSDDDSRPTNNYLPKGTVDYVVGHSYFGDKEYLNLRCGKRVYVTKSNDPSPQKVQVSKEYAGRLPETNQLSVADFKVTADATYLTLDTAWKAPFLLDLLPQKYTNPKTQDYTVSKVTCEYVQITFCYADSLKKVPTIGENHPVFTRATVTDTADGQVLRLYLRKVGGFYGWDASYNSKGQLVFYFLHPAQVTAANNAYGADLTGVTIMLDVGHGGKSGGAGGLDEDHPERERNYNLAVLLKTELERMGATVVLNRGPKEDLTADERCQELKALKPDLCIAIHHDSNVSSKPHGFGSFYSTLFSANAAKFIYNTTMAANIYNTTSPGERNRLDWHYYFVARVSDCPVVLTENGYMSSPIDHVGIVDYDINVRKAQAIAKGVAQYFLSIRQPGLEPIVTKTTTTTKPTTTTVATTGTTTVATTKPATTKPVTTTTTQTTTATTTESTTATTTESTTEATEPAEGSTTESATTMVTEATESTSTDAVLDEGDTTVTDATLPTESEEEM